MKAGDRVICVDSNNKSSLTEGCIYEIICRYFEGNVEYVQVINDDFYLSPTLFACRFIPVPLKIKEVYE